MGRPTPERRRIRGACRSASRVLRAPLRLLLALDRDDQVRSIDRYRRTSSSGRSWKVHSRFLGVPAPAAPHCAATSGNNVSLVLSPAANRGPYSSSISSFSATSPFPPFFPSSLPLSPRAPHPTPIFFPFLSLYISFFPSPLSRLIPLVSFSFPPSARARPAAPLAACRKPPYTYLSTLSCSFSRSPFFLSSSPFRARVDTVPRPVHKTSWRYLLPAAVAEKETQYFMETDRYWGVHYRYCPALRGSISRGRGNGTTGMTIAAWEKGAEERRERRERESLSLSLSRRVS